MLYIVGTPLGNIEDMSLRGAKTLCASDVILVEDTRSFAGFYKRISEMFNIQPKDKQKIISFHDQNEFKQVPYILKMLDNNMEVSLVSEAGMPLVSDPGLILMKEARKRTVGITCIPGPTAFVTASVLSGFDTSSLLFIGFLPKKESEKRKLFMKFTEMKSVTQVLSVAFYESPQRLIDTLNLVNEILPNSAVAICRELTKKFEEVTVGDIQDMLDRNYKGEITAILSC